MPEFLLISELGISKIEDRGLAHGLEHGPASYSDQQYRANRTHQIIRSGMPELMTDQAGFFRFAWFNNGDKSTHRISDSSDGPGLE